MSKELIEKVARAMCLRSYAAQFSAWSDIEWKGAVDKDWHLWEPEARAAILAVLEHFSEPGNITVAMLEECGPAYSLAAAMRAAKEGI